ncbi:uncharacterized protein [Nicotiana tomentosiformis]|uniref:uncharacterized protein n=1 Tax=Nicotiana tomentosiformis TaxID=4098 RepID=UPI00388C915A
MVEQGCDAYLAYVRDVSVANPTMESVPIVRDFPDILLADHPGATKMNHDIRGIYLWDRIKKYIAKCVAQCPNCQQMAPYEALHRRKCMSPIRWFEIGETKLVGPELVQQSVEKIKLIRERILAAHSHQKSYADNGQRDLEFQVDDWVIEQLSYEEAPISILDRQVRRLRTNDVDSVKVLWINNNVEEMTWEAEEEMKTGYPHFFSTSGGGSN